MPLPDTQTFRYLQISSRHLQGLLRYHACCHKDSCGDGRLRVGFRISLSRKQTQQREGRGICRAGNEERIQQASVNYVEGRCSWIPSCLTVTSLCTLEHSRAHAGLKEGIGEDDLVAYEMGLADASQMSNVQEKYKDRIKQKLKEVCLTVQLYLILSLCHSQFQL